MDVADCILESVRGGSTQGSQLAQSVRSRYPDWTPEQAGARNLRDFIDRFVDGVTVVGHAGMDVIYGLAGEGVEGGLVASTGGGDALEVNLWRVWVSPNSPYALSIDQEEGEVTQMPRSDSRAVGHVRLDPAPQDDHQEVAREFARRLEGQREVVLPAIGSRDGWWLDWQKGLKALGLESAWHEYRSTALEERLRASLEAQDLSDDARERALAAIIADRSVGRRAPAQRPEPPRDERAILEAVLFGAIKKMDMSDLRELKIPVGVVLDVVAQRTPR